MTRRKQPPVISVDVYRIPALRPPTRRGIRISFNLFYVSMSDKSIRVRLEPGLLARVIDLPLCKVSWKWAINGRTIKAVIPLWLAKDRRMI